MFAADPCGCAPEERQQKKFEGMDIEASRCLVLDRASCALGRNCSSPAASLLTVAGRKVIGQRPSHPSLAETPFPLDEMPPCFEQRFGMSELIPTYPCFCWFVCVSVGEPEVVTG